MFILRFINDDDDLSVKEFVSLADLKESRKNMASNRRSKKSNTKS